MPTRPVSPQQGLVIYAKNKKQVSAFYQQTLQLVAVEQESTHDLLRGRGIELVIHAIPRKYASRIKITTPPQIREDTPLKPTFFVRDLRIRAKGGGDQRWFATAQRTGMAI